ncbi:MAG: hypothetical protein AAGJ08_18105 [Cyanobacteria bacterium P01_H01_bin.35]
MENLFGKNTEISIISELEKLHGQETLVRDRRGKIAFAEKKSELNKRSL